MNEKTCFEIDGAVKPQSILPANVSAFQVKHLILICSSTTDYDEHNSVF